MAIDQKFWSQFEKVDIRRGTSAIKNVHVDNKKTCLCIPKKFIEAAGWTGGERVDLYRFGETFALKPYSAGVLNVRTVGGGSARINSKDLVITVMAFTQSCMVFDTWVEGNVIVFKPKREAE